MKWMSLMALIALPLSAIADPFLPGVDDAIKPYIDRGEISGAVAMVIRDDKVAHLSAQGLSDLATQRPMKTDDLFWVASQTKPMTAACLLMLVEEGKVAIDDPLEKYLPEFKNLWQIEQQSPERMVLKKNTVKPTLRHLLTHTSGLADLPMPHEGTPLSEMVAGSSRLPLKYEPGTEWRYTNANSNALGRIIEVVSKMPYEQFLQERLLTPLGMKDTTFYPTEEQAKRVATSYTISKSTGKLEATQSVFINGPLTSRKRTVMPAGGLYSTVDDIRRFSQMLLNGGELDGRRYLKPETVAEMTKTQTGDLKTGFTEGLSFGLHLGVIKTPTGVTGMLSPGTFGHGGAYGTAMWIDPQRKLIVLLMIQRAGLVPNGDGCELRKDYQTAVVKALHP